MSSVRIKYNLNFHISENFIKLKKLWYPRGIKILPISIVYDLDTIFVAQLIMDDGYSSGNKTIISTKCYDRKDHEILIDAFRERLNINATLTDWKKPTVDDVNNRQYRTLVDVRNLFKNEKYVCESMLYKITNQRASEDYYKQLNKINVYKYIIVSKHGDKLCEAIHKQQLFCNICNEFRDISHTVYNQHLKKDLCVKCGVLYEPFAEHNCQKFFTRCKYCKIWLGSNRAIQEHESRHANKIEIINNQFTIYDIK